MPTKKKKKRVTFEIAASSDSEVFVAGTFNDWKEDDKQLQTNNDSGIFSKRIMIEKGTHEYKYIVNGEWFIDEDTDSIPNGVGSFNHIMRVN